MKKQKARLEFLFGLGLILLQYGALIAFALAAKSENLFAVNFMLILTAMGCVLLAISLVGFVILWRKDAR